MSEFNILRAVRELLSRVGLSDKEIEPQAACRKCQDRVPAGKRLYYAFDGPQRCVFCGAECEPGECVAF